MNKKKKKLKNRSTKIVRIMIVIINLFLDISLSFFLYDTREVKNSIYESAMRGMNTIRPAM